MTGAVIRAHRGFRVGAAVEVMMSAISPDDGGTSRKAEVVNRLREEILSGRLLPGEPIRDAVLADHFGISITPVREAVTQLISKGLVTSLPNKRRQVTVLTPEGPRT